LQEHRRTPKSTAMKAQEANNMIFTNPHAITSPVN